MRDLGHYYEVLGLKEDASLLEIKEAYRDLVKVWHPDRFPGDKKLEKKANEKLKEINEAYQVLTEYSSRRQATDSPQEGTKQRSARRGSEDTASAAEQSSPQEGEPFNRGPGPTSAARRSKSPVPILLTLLVLAVALTIRTYYRGPAKIPAAPTVSGTTEPASLSSTATPPPKSTVPSGLPAQPPPSIAPSSPPTRLVTANLKCGPLIAHYSTPGEHPGFVHVASGLGKASADVTDWSISAVECHTVTGAEALDLVIGSFSGGAHCCATVQVFSLRPSFRRVLFYQGAEFYGRADIRRDRNGTYGLVLNDKHFAYFDQLCYACSPSTLPLVACFRDDSFEDCTAEHPSVVADSIRTYTDSLNNALNMSNDNPEAREQTIRGMALGLYASYILANRESEGRIAITDIVASDSVITWLASHKSDIVAWLASRGAQSLHK